MVYMSFCVFVCVCRELWRVERGFLQELKRKGLWLKKKKGREIDMVYMSFCVGVCVLCIYRDMESREREREDFWERDGIYMRFYVYNYIYR